MKESERETSGNWRETQKRIEIRKWKGRQEPYTPADNFSVAKKCMK